MSASPPGRPVDGAVVVLVPPQIDLRAPREAGVRERLAERPDLQPQPRWMRSLETRSVVAANSPASA